MNDISCRDATLLKAEKRKLFGLSDYLFSENDSFQECLSNCESLAALPTSRRSYC